MQVYFLLPEKLGLAGGGFFRGFEADFSVGFGHGDAALGGAFDVALHDQIRLVHFLDRSGFLANGDGEAVHTDGTAVEKSDDRFEDPLVHFVETIGVNVEHGESIGGGLGGDFSAGADEGVVAHPAQEVVGDAGRAARPPRDLTGAVIGQGLDVLYARKWYIRNSF